MSRAAAPKSKKNTYQDYVAAMGRLSEAAKSGALPGVILLHGPSDFLIGKTIKVLKEHWRGQGELQILEAPELDEQKFASLAGQKSLFDPAGLFIIRRLEQAKNAAKWLKFASADNSGGSHFCFVQQGGVLAAGLKGEFARLKTLEIPCVEPWPNELAPLVQGMARKLSLNLQNEAVALILEAVGNDLVKIENELTRLSLIFAETPSDQTLDARTIAPLLGMLREDFVFELDNLLISRQYGKAHALLTALLHRGESALALLGILARHCRLALRLHDLQRNGRPLNPRDISFELRLPLQVAKGYTQYVAKTTAKTFAASLVLCQEMDQKLKSSGINEELLLGQVLETLRA